MRDLAVGVNFGVKKLQARGVFLRGAAELTDGSRASFFPPTGHRYASFWTDVGVRQHNESDFR
jgi:hypothetical protein